MLSACKNSCERLNDVRAQTRDGIELTTDVSAEFGLAGRPAVIQAAYDGSQDVENLQNLQIDPQTRRIHAIINELDEFEKEEIHRFAKDFLFFMKQNSSLHIDQDLLGLPPIWIDEPRILSGVYSRARNVGDEQSASHWTDLPAMVAAETYRNMVAHYALDELYLPDDPERFPLQRGFKPEFSRHIRMLGAVSFQFIQRQDGEPPDLGQRVDHRNFRISAAQELKTSKVLRQRGINVLNADFCDPTPTDPLVNQQRLDNWRARWQQEVNRFQEDRDRELANVKNQAFLNRQSEILELLSQLFNQASFSEAELTRNLFEQLEIIASNPIASQMIPRETVDQISLIKALAAPR